VDRLKTSQRQPAADLAKLVKLHQEVPWQKPLSAHSSEAFEALRPRVEAHSGPLIIDSCCGTGDSTRNLAGRFPEALVVGVDKSAHRLARHQPGDRKNYALVRADVNDFWRLAKEARWRPTQHYLLYPNPYPKAAQLRKRWHGAPVFPDLVGLGGLLTVRTNWSVYVQEFALALHSMGYSARQNQLNIEEPISAFEQKYRARGHALYELICDLDQFRIDQKC